MDRRMERHRPDAFLDQEGKADPQLEFRVETAFLKIKGEFPVKKDETAENDGVHLGKDAVIETPLGKDPVLDQRLAEKHVGPDVFGDAGKDFRGDFPRPQEDFAEPFL